MEVIGGVRQRREPGDQRGQRQQRNLARAPQRSTRGAGLVGTGEQGWQAELHQRHEAKRRRERHLKAGMDQRFRRQQQHDQCRDRQRPKSDRLPVDYHGDQHHRGHQKRALRRDLGSGQRQIERGGGERGAGRVFLDRTPHRQRRQQRQQRAHRKEHHARHHRHVIAGDRQHMPKAGDEHRVVDRRRNGIAPPGQERGGDGAVIALQHDANARIDGVADALQRRGIAQCKAAALRRRLDGDRAQHPAGGADALKIQVAREIIATGLQRLHRRGQPRFQLDKAASGGRGALAHRQPHPLQADGAARRVHMGDAQHEAVAALALLAALDKAF